MSSRTHRLQLFVLLLLTAALLPAGRAKAQADRRDGGFFVGIGGGATLYLGDLYGSNPQGVGAVGSAVGAELGYRFSDVSSLSTLFHSGLYPRTRRIAGANARRQVLSVLLRQTFAPAYFEFGAQGVFGGERAGYGPALGVGLDLTFSRLASFFLGVRFGVVLPDDATDGTAGHSPADPIAWLGGGLRLNLSGGRPARTEPARQPPEPVVTEASQQPGRAAETPDAGRVQAGRVVVVRLDGPDTLRVGEEGSFSALAGEAEAEVRSLWDFGDGTSGSGFTTTHAYAQPGSYTVAFTASSPDGVDSKRITVAVVSAADPAAARLDERPGPSGPLRADSAAQALPGESGVRVLEIAGPDSLVAGEAGTFTARLSETGGNVQSLWNFGDGTERQGLTASHIYRQAGRYTLTFAASGAGGIDTRTKTVTVTPPSAAARIDSVEVFPTNASVGRTVYYTASVKGQAPVDCRWSFGDGSTGTGCVVVTHVYDKPGPYRVELIVSNPSGTDRRTVNILVEQ